MSATKRVLKSLFTDRDNESQDMTKWLAAIAFLVAMGLTVFQVIVRNKEFDIILYSTGVAGLMGILAAALRWKDPVTPIAPIITVNNPSNTPALADVTTTTVTSSSDSASVTKT